MNFAKKIGFRFAYSFSVAFPLTDPSIGYMIFDVSELQRVYGELKNTGDAAQSVE